MRDGTETSPTARALLTLELIQNTPGITGERLGARLGVSDRAARRYVGVLREAGIPVESVPGRHGGYRVGHGFRVPPLMFTTAEALGLVMAVLQGRGGPGASADPSLAQAARTGAVGGADRAAGAVAAEAGGAAEDPAETALSKIIRVLPAPTAGSAGAIRRLSARVPFRNQADPDPETTGALVQACAERRRLRLGYRPSAGAERVMEVDPWAVSLRFGRWYLLCWSHTSDARRVLRVDRVVSCQVLAGTFTPPGGLDPLRLIEEHLGQGWTYAVDIVIDAPLAQAAEWISLGLGRLEPDGAQRTRLIGGTESLAWYAQRLAAIPVPFHVVGPAELRCAVADLGRRMLDAAG